MGWTGSVAGFLIVSYYTMIAGWVLAYTWYFLSGNYVQGAAAATRKFHAFIADSRAVSLWQLGFFALVALISARGVNRGVEWANRWRAPALLAILLVLVAYSLVTGDVARGLTFAFAPDFTRLTPAVVLGAVGQALYALGVSAGIMIAYGAYMSAGESLGRVVLAVVGSIFAVSLLATVAIFPLVFHYGLDPAGGPQLVFEVLPVAFAEMPGGRVIGTLFFALLISPRSLRRWDCWSRGSRGWSSALECGGPSRQASSWVHAGWSGRARCCHSGDGPPGIRCLGFRGSRRSTFSGSWIS